MERFVVIGRSFVAVALIGLGLEHFIFGDFIIGRAPPWPETVSGGWLWAYLSGAAFVVFGISILSGKYARNAALLASALIFLWALLRHVPVVLGDSFLSGAWTQAGKALTFVGGLLAVAATFPGRHSDDGIRDPAVVSYRREFVIAGRYCLGFFLVLTGIQHFIFTEFVASLIPTWFPGNAVFWTYFAGVALIAGGLGLFYGRVARMAAFLSGLMVFSWFWIVHIPRTFVGVSDSIAVFEALAVSGIAFVIAGCMSRRAPGVEADREHVVV